jgi:simple sugar transport system substrate-binding protein
MELKMSHISKLTRRLILALAIVLVAAVGTSGILHTSAQDQRPYRIVVVTHGQAADPFWSVVKKGIDQAGIDMRVKTEYQAPDKFDMVAMSQLIDAAVASKPDGLVVSLPDVTALGPSVKKAIAAGIPVISINSGYPDAFKLGVLAHIGQTEYDAGVGGGQRMADAGAKNALCVNQEVGNVGLDQRCQGFTDAMTKAGGKVKVLAVDLNDPTGASGKIAAALQADSSIDSILTLGPTGAAPALKALTDGKLLGKIKLATFDLSPDVLAAIQAGNILFAIDQQQYTQGYLSIVYMTLYLSNLNTPGNQLIIQAGNILFAIDQQQYTQGYLSIVYMTLYLSNLNTPGNQLIPTGPGFVTKDNAAQIIKLSAAGTR